MSCVIDISVAIINPQCGVYPLIVFVDGDGAFFRLTLYFTPFGDGLDHGVNLEGNTPSVVKHLSFCAKGKE